MSTSSLAIVVLIVLLLVSTSGSPSSFFGEELCKKSQYTCVSVKRKDSWSSLFPQEEVRDIVKRINRINVFLQQDMVLALPKNFSQIDLDAASPFPKYHGSSKEKTIYVDLRQLAWGAYDATGKLVKWGPISPGTTKCFDAAGCSTPKGNFRVISKKGSDCVSNKYPVRMNGVLGGGEMPFCIFFYKGYAFHGSSELPGYPASAGCIRLFIEDAKWLNEQFVELSSKNKAGTLIHIF